jgi:hypothetical protein
MQVDQNSNWYSFLSPWQRDLVDTSVALSQRHDYLADLDDFSFIVFPMAKAYEGFLKKVLLDLNLISPKVYESKKFRIGRSLNPDIRQNQRDQYWLYDDLKERSNADVIRQAWDAWLKCRNRVFHFFPNGIQKLSWEEAESRLKMMEEAMENLVVSTKLNQKIN